jgi:hypothetical protein
VTDAFSFITSEPNSDSPLELAHVLFTDIVGYSKLLGNQQRELFQRLNQIICGTRQFQTARRALQLSQRSIQTVIVEF